MHTSVQEAYSKITTLTMYSGSKSIGTPNFFFLVANEKSVFIAISVFINTYKSDVITNGMIIKIRESKRKISMLSMLNSGVLLEKTTEYWNVIE